MSFTEMMALHLHNSGLELIHIWDDVVGDNDYATDAQALVIVKRLCAIRD